MAVRILIVTPESDLHGKVVAERLKSLGAEVDFWATTLFPWIQRASWKPGTSLSGAWGAPADFHEYHRIWWRRFQRPTPSPLIEDTHVKSFSASEAELMLRGLFSLEEGRIVNRPETERYLSRKLVQLQIAFEENLRIPKTLISNNRDDIVRFIETNHRTIVKPISNGYPHSIETRECTGADFSDEVIVGLAPHIYQELVEAALDIRVFIAGDIVFAGELAREDTNIKVDWRMMATGWRPHKLPNSVRNDLLRLTRRMGLLTASHDLRMTPDQDYVFLETNPSGQFLFLEVDCDLPLSMTLAKLLIS